MESKCLITAYIDVDYVYKRKLKRKKKQQHLPVRCVEAWTTSQWPPLRVHCAMDDTNLLQIMLIDIPKHRPRIITLHWWIQ